MENDLLKNLNPEQHKAVVHENGPLLILAGAGTGKTMAITKRIAYLVSEKKAKTDEILALTFTDKSAGEMEERVDKLLPYGYTDLWISTFHSFCERILKEHALDIGLPGDFELLSQTGQWLLVRQNLDKFDLDYYRPLGNPVKFIHALLTHFSRAKDEVIEPKEYLEYVKNLTLDKDSAEHNLLEDEIKRLKEVANAYHTYQQILLENNALDFGDLINYTLKLFRERPRILDVYKKQFKYILVDEFQDTNYAQYELIKLLAAPKNNLTVVGDDDQCLPGDAIIDLPKGTSKIKDIRPGIEIVTAVGKGHLGISRVDRVFKKRKKVRLLTIKTESGKKVMVTDNHKMFCYIPKVSDKKFFYVYLMHKQDMGWRLGMTNDLALRLRLERSADKIIGINSFKTQEEARFFEAYISLKYGIPTICFKERGNQAIKNDSFKKLYGLLCVDNNVMRLSSDLNIDIKSHHYCLQAVNRGNKARIKINLELCQRKYRSKDFVKKQKLFMRNPLISHTISLETSSLHNINKLKKAGYAFKKTKKGFRLRYQSQDIKKLGEMAIEIQKITDGIIDYKFKVGKLKHQHLPAIVVPAKNILSGFYLPVRNGREVFYEQVVGIEETYKNIFVYDLEVDKTHNFIADGVVVHNSIYKFRGASISNILQFKEDFPACKEILLIKNYRSGQNILDLSYKFIQQNNPNRLEVKLGDNLSKQLESQIKENGHVEHLNFDTLQNEAEGVAEKIIELKNNNDNIPSAVGGTSWSDFAILVRANDHANPFISILNRKGIPYQFFALRGLYSKPIILDILSYFKAIYDYHDNPSFYRILNFPIWNIAPLEISKINYEVRRSAKSIFEVLKVAATLSLDVETQKIIQKVLSFVEKHSSLAKEKLPSELLLTFLNDTEYHKYILDLPEQSKKENLSFLDQFYKRIKKSETDSNFRTNEFLEEIEYELEAGDEGALSFDPDVGPDMVRIMTIHAAKGLEFDYVFIPNLVDKRFPTIKREEKIPLPDALIKEILPEGDIHLEEERRLFYVAVTRAKKGLFLTSAEDYGGARKKKPSRFLIELDFVRQQAKKTSSKNNILNDLEQKPVAISTLQNAEKYIPPSYFSFSALAAFNSCPLQYKYSHVLKVHSFGKAVFSYGKTMHNTLHKFISEFLKRKDVNQTTLFDVKSDNSQSVSVDELLKYYEESWIDEWFENKKQKEEYKKTGRESLKRFYEKFQEEKPQPLAIEKGFYLRIGDCTLKGRIDRIDKAEDGIEIIDYKTGQSKGDKISKDDKKQLLIYQMAAEQCMDLKPKKLTYYYLNDNKTVSFLGTEKEKQSIQQKIMEDIEKIKNSDFMAAPKDGERTCITCDFKNICNYKQS